MTRDAARFELYRLQTDCTRAGLSYVDIAWNMRYSTPAPKPSDAWPMQRIVEQPSNITTMTRGRK